MSEHPERTPCVPKVVIFDSDMRLLVKPSKRYMPLLQKKIQHCFVYIPVITLQASHSKDLNNGIS